jgi:hypothetical protein
MNPAERRNLDPGVLRSAQPDLAVVWEPLVSWISHHSSSRYLDPRNLVQDLRNIPVQKLNRAIDVLIDQGYLVQVYKLIDPGSHTLLSGEYPSPPAVPEKVRDRRDQWIDTDDLEIVPFLKAQP